MKILILITLLWQNTATVTVTVSGIENTKGSFSVAIFKEKAGFPKDHEEAWQRKRVKAKNGKVEVQFTGIPHGGYAISVFHDENNSGKAETNLIGLPKEGVGISNNLIHNVPPPPSFKRASFKVDGDTFLDIKLRYF